MAELKTDSLFPLRTHAHLILSGRIGRGGEGRLIIDGQTIPFDLADRQFVLLAVLLEANRADLAAAPPRPASGFRTKDEIFLLMRALFMKVDPELAADLEISMQNRHMHGLRKTFTQAVKTRLGVAEWGHQFVEHSDALGTRISAPPENLTWEIVTDALR